jgi:hypothetical protein
VSDLEWLVGFTESSPSETCLSNRNAKIFPSL